MVSYRNDIIVAKKYYIGEYEYTDSVEANRKKEVTYISAPTGLIAANVKIDTIPTFYYVLTDHLGSITQLLHSNGDPVINAQFTYDAWGRLRDVRNATDRYKLDYIIKFITDYEFELIYYHPILLGLQITIPFYNHDFPTWQSWKFRKIKGK